MITPARPAARAVSTAPQSFHVPEGAEVVTIKEESDDEDDADFQTPVNAPGQTQRTPKNARDFARAMGIDVVDGMVSLEELKSWHERHEDKIASKRGQIKVLTYAMHFAGITRFQIERMKMRVNGGGFWEPKVEAILGHERRGRRRDGEPIRRR